MIRAGIASGLAVVAVALALWIASAERTEALLAAFAIEAAPGARSRSPRLPVRLLSAGAVIAAIVGFRFAGVAGSVAAAAAVAAAPSVVRKRRARKRDRLVQEHVADAIALIATAMRSGRSLLQAIDLTATEVDASLAATFRRLVDRIELGDPMDEGIDAWAVDVGGADARLVAGVLKLHRRTGGSLSTTLEDLAGTLRSRRSAAREVESLTAQARLSATILGLLPIGFFLFLSVVAREDLEAAYESPAGVGAIALGFLLQGVAYVWIRSLLRVEP